MSEELEAEKLLSAAIDELESLKAWADSAPHETVYGRMSPRRHRIISAQLDILRAGLMWFDDFKLEAPTYSDGRSMGAQRMFKVTPEGRACLKLASAILGRDDE